MNTVERIDLSPHPRFFVVLVLWGVLSDKTFRASIDFVQVTIHCLFREILFRLHATTEAVKRIAGQGGWVYLQDVAVNVGRHREKNLGVVLVIEDIDVMLKRLTASQPHVSQGVRIFNRFDAEKERHKVIEVADRDPHVQLLLLSRRGRKQSSHIYQLGQSGLLRCWSCVVVFEVCGRIGFLIHDFSLVRIIVEHRAKHTALVSHNF